MTSNVSSAKATALVGATGLVARLPPNTKRGSYILKTLLRIPQISTVFTVSRRQPEVADPESRLKSFVDADSEKWASNVSFNMSQSEIFFSGLGTTRGAAGSLVAQRKIDYDLNLELARAAKEAGIRVYVLISAAGANSTSYIPYSKMKGELEEAITAIGFEKAIFLKPGFLIGKRPTPKFGESGAQAVANMMGKVSGGRLKDVWAQDAEVVARAAVSAGLLASDGKAPEGKVWNLGQSDIVRLGRTEWQS